jgi:predicted enzyme related to lactoylglutathione lyase
MHDIVHTEISGPDSAALAKFYNAVFGWQCELSNVGSDYYVWRTGEGERMQGGGLRQFEAGEEQAPSRRILLYIEVADIEAALALIEQQGGRPVSGKEDIGGGHGFTAHFRDPGGNTLGLWAQH